jgi:arylsulfatase A-like enzyme
MLRQKVSIAILILLCITFNSLHAQISKPNIIFIFADDLGYGDIGCYGQKKIETPNIDLLAKQGLKFTNFYAGSTVCAPSRASLMTGLHTGHTPVRGNQGFEPEGQAPLPDSVVTIATLLQQNGYATGAFGKWGMGYITTTGDPNKKGFDQFFGYNCQSLAHNYYPDHLWNNHERIDFKSNLGKTRSILAISFINTLWTSLRGITTNHSSRSCPIHYHMEMSLLLMIQSTNTILKSLMSSR